MMQTLKGIQTAAQTVKPVVCCECGMRPKEKSEVHLKRAGWQGFSRLHKERMGMCPECVAEHENGTREAV
jgi:hypothetical protein